ncbi:MAG: hypothetical protein NWE89_13715 [Candidatus Bathyarchaeota archaeon]|nr:hypothetical protein [Candidatus Bathyarchaeota archaeon]
MSEYIVDTNLQWTIHMDVGGEKDAELPLFQVTHDIEIEPGFAEKIKYLILENPHYYPGENVTHIFSPEKDECVGKALFMVICFLKEYAEKKTGSLNHFMFGELKSEGFKLIAAADKELTVGRFKFFMNIITRKPELVKNLVLTHNPS